MAILLRHGRFDLRKLYIEYDVISKLSYSFFGGRKPQLRQSRVGANIDKKEHGEREFPS